MSIIVFIQSRIIFYYYRSFFLLRYFYLLSILLTCENLSQFLADNLSHWSLPRLPFYWRLISSFGHSSNGMSTHTHFVGSVSLPVYGFWRETMSVWTTKFPVTLPVTSMSVVLFPLWSSWVQYLHSLFVGPVYPKTPIIFLQTENEPYSTFQ